MYVDDLSDYLVNSQIGCHLDNVCVNHVMYADDICLMAPSPAALQKLIDQFHVLRYCFLNNVICNADLMIAHRHVFVFNNYDRS